MALSCSKRLFLKIFSNNAHKCLFPISENYSPLLLPSVFYSVSYDLSGKKLSRAMKAYMERAQKYDQLIKEQLEQYETGKKHLANMMGKKGQKMTQAEIDEAIEYLFPSGLFSPRARPIMKHPREVFAERKSVEFDSTGRPFHYLFYTAKPRFSEILHDAAKHLEKINEYEAKMKKSGIKKPEKQLILPGEWMSKEDLEKKLLEIIFTTEHEKFVEVFDRLLNHPYGYLVDDFIKLYRIVPESLTDETIVKPTVAEDGTSFVHIPEAKRKRAIASVTVHYPGEGKIQINHTGINYFHNIQSREQILFPLLFTDMLSKVNVVAKVENGGETSQAGAIRLGIALALQSFVSTEMALKMKVAGLLQKDFRRRERKKPGKEGARRSYTWLKR